MKKIISFIFVFVCLFFYSDTAIEQDSGNIDVDKEINIVMKKLIQKLEKNGFAELRDDMIQDFKTLRSYYRDLDMAKQLNDKKLIQEVNWFIKITESRIKSNLKFIRSLEVQFEEIEKELRKLLEQKKEEIKNRKIAKQAIF